jgi:hypothetical protein
MLTTFDPQEVRLPAAQQRVTIESSTRSPLLHRAQQERLGSAATKMSQWPGTPFSGIGYDCPALIRNVIDVEVNTLGSTQSQQLPISIPHSLLEY